MTINTPQSYFIEKAMRYMNITNFSCFVCVFWVCCVFGFYDGEAEGSSWIHVKNWGYQLQDIKLDDLTASPFDLLVIDYSRDGSDSGRFTRGDIEILKKSLKGGRLVLAYVSIGEAESYRFYWKRGWEKEKPSWLGRENPNWEENYKVHYWDPDWKQIVFRYLNKILAAGFDGVYLDIIDAYEYYEERGRKSAANEMKQLVQEIANYAREASKNQSFGVFPQNGEELLADDEYLSVITGIGKEDTYFGYEEEDLRTPQNVTVGVEQFLELAKQAHKLVLNVDYTTSPRKMVDAYTRSLNRGYVEYCATRELDLLVPQPWFGNISPEK
ncbi:MAG: hypothetical protein GY777_29140 [Candidatus Brocadiaceae bacterium]|nr:hypothetical protein [Candidatus Brocadiaceae bacterium]